MNRAPAALPATLPSPRAPDDPKHARAHDLFLARVAPARGFQEIGFLLPADNEMHDLFWRVAFSGSVAVIGAFGDDNGSGSVYLLDVAAGVELAKLMPRPRIPV